MLRAVSPFRPRNETGSLAVGAPDEASPTIEREHRSSGVVPICASRNEPIVSGTLPVAQPSTGANDPDQPLIARVPSPAPAARATSSVATDRLRVGMLSAVAGYVDAAGFVTLLGLFPAHLTGEIVGMTLAVANGGGSSLRTHLAMIPVFVGSVVLGVLVARAFRRHGHTPLVPLSWPLNPGPTQLLGELPLPAGQQSCESCHQLPEFGALPDY